MRHMCKVWLSWTSGTKNVKMVEVMPVQISECLILPDPAITNPFLFIKSYLICLKELSYTFLDGLWIIDDAFAALTG